MNELEMDTAAMVLSICFHANNNYYFLKKLQKNLVFRNKSTIFVSRNKKKFFHFLCNIFGFYPYIYIYRKKQ